MITAGRHAADTFSASSVTPRALRAAAYFQKRWRKSRPPSELHFRAIRTHAHFDAIMPTLLWFQLYIFLSFEAFLEHWLLYTYFTASYFTAICFTFLGDRRHRITIYAEYASDFILISFRRVYRRQRMPTCLSERFKHIAERKNRCQRRR